MATLPIAIFWLCAALIVYAHAGYPLLLTLRARFKPWPIRRDDGLPEVTAIVIAHNEGERIDARIRNLLEQDYPGERLRVIVGSDGSTDDTVERASAKQNTSAVRVVHNGLQRGKPAFLNELIPAATSPIVLLCDARQRFEPDALKHLVAPFADPKVGAVSGELELDSLYWRYEKLLRRTESDIDSTLGATGAIYAIRRELFEPIPTDTVLDDMLIPARIVQRGYRVVFEPHAKAHDVPADPDKEFARKTRTLAGNFQLFSREKWLLNPFANRIFFQTLSHKLLRLACPVLLAATLLASAILAHRGFYEFALVAQLGFYAAALIGRFLSRRHGADDPRTQKNVAEKFASAAYQFCLLHMATVAGFIRYARGQATAAWKRDDTSKHAGPSGSASHNTTKERGLVLP